MVPEAPLSSPVWQIYASVMKSVESAPLCRLLPCRRSHLLIRSFSPARRAVSWAVKPGLGTRCPLPSVLENLRGSQSRGASVVSNRRALRGGGDDEVGDECRWKREEHGP